MQRLLAVVDVNVVISGSIARGPSRQVLEAARLGLIELAMSTRMFESLADVLQRPDIERRLRPLSADQTVTRLLEFLIVMDIDLRIPSTSRDPDDDDVLACALQLKADLIVSGDQDLRVLDSYEGIPIVSALDCARAVGLG